MEEHVLGLKSETIARNFSLLHINMRSLHILKITHHFFVEEMGTRKTFDVKIDKNMGNHGNLHMQYWGQDCFRMNFLNR